MYTYSNPGTSGWMETQISKLRLTISSFYKNSATSLSPSEYSKIQKCLLDAEEIAKGVTAKDRRTIVVRHDAESDISTFGTNSIFTPYFCGKDKATFEDYFNKNLNPDLSGEGFLEELDTLIQISYNRKVAIATTGVDNIYEMECVNVLEEYLSSLPPF